MYLFAYEHVYEHVSEHVCTKRAAERWRCQYYSSRFVNMFVNIRKYVRINCRHATCRFLYNVYIYIDIYTQIYKNMKIAKFANFTNSYKIWIMEFI